MPGFLIDHIVPIVAALMVLFGLAALLPTASSFLRGRRLAAAAAGTPASGWLFPDGAGDAEATTDRRRPGLQSAKPPRPPRPRRTEPESESPLAQADGDKDDLPDANAVLDEDEYEDEDEEDAEFEDEPEEPEGQEPAADPNDFMSLFSERAA